jgi:hypothetical protein
LFIGSEEQTSFTSAKDAILTAIQTNTQNITFDNDTTTVNGDVDVVGTLNLITKLSPLMIGNGDVSATQLSYLNSLNGNVLLSMASL